MTKKPGYKTPQAGDIFEFELSDGRNGYGFVVLGGGVPYIAMFEGAHSKRPPTQHIIGCRIVLVGTTMDGLLYHGKWNVIDRIEAMPKNIPFPNWKVGIDGKEVTTNFEQTRSWTMNERERDLLDYKFSSSPKIYQDAFEALHGIGKWQPHFDKLLLEYARQRVTRRKLLPWL